MRLLLDEKQTKVIVKNISKNIEYVYLNLSCADALINSAMIESRMVCSSLHDPCARDKFKKKILLGSITASIDDLVVIIDDSDRY